MLLIAFSCNNENPVQPDDSTQLDTARFNWQVTRMNYFTGGEMCYSFWSPDTNEVFMCSRNNYLVHFKDGHFTEIHYGANIQMYSIDGISINEGYIVGSELINGKRTPHIEKWNGSSFSNVPLNYNYDKNFDISAIKIKSSNEMWFSSPKGIIHKFDGYNLTQYYLSDTISWSNGFLYDESNRLRYLTEYFNTGIDTLQRDFVYEFDGQVWSKVYQDIFPVSTRIYGIFYNIIYAYGVTHIIYKLNNNVLNAEINTEINNGSIPLLAGNSISNIMGFGSTINNPQTFFHWNGQKWSNENVGNEGSTFDLYRKMINDNYFCAIKGSLNSSAYLYRGYRKH
jgi:hypothetical protein